MDSYHHWFSFSQSLSIEQFLEMATLSKEELILPRHIAWLISFSYQFIIMTRILFRPLKYVCFYFWHYFLFSFCHPLSYLWFFCCFHIFILIKLFSNNFNNIINQQNLSFLNWYSRFSELICFERFLFIVRSALYLS